MEYLVTNQNIRLTAGDFPVCLNTPFRRDGISNSSEVFTSDGFGPISSLFRGLHTNPSPLLIDLTATDNVGGGSATYQSSADSATTTPSHRFTLYLVRAGVRGGVVRTPRLTEVAFGGVGPFFSIPTFSGFCIGSEWCERECWDMFGIVFDGNRDLRRLLTDYGFSGFPLRKDFPVVGFVETHYDDELLQLRLEKISLAQEMRPFLFQSGGSVV